MPQRLPRWFCALFAVVMLLTCAMVAGSFVRRQSLAARIDRAENELSIVRGQLAKQRYEYQQAQSQLPVARAELAQVAPEAEKAAAQVAELRAKRRSLRELNAAQSAELAALQAELEAANAQVAELERRVDTAQSALSQGLERWKEWQAFVE